jgi:hypothetical protein
MISQRTVVRHNSTTQHQRRTHGDDDDYVLFAPAHETQPRRRSPGHAARGVRPTEAHRAVRAG